MKRWDRQHAVRPGADQPSSFLREILDRNGWQIPPGLALDMATGNGRNALFLAERGFTVIGIDVSSIALEEARRRAAEKFLQITWRRADLEQMQLPHEAYDLIVNFNYLQRSLIPHIKKSLKVGGHVIFETFLIDQQAIGHPKNPAYLLQHN
ncbi:MAG: methyltransferase domain-containing protein, partial [Deltaproteobacteria bacterium]|nr:methyltransferase domain-containing protein [Deltaproteobacteria bacterium]